MKAKNILKKRYFFLEIVRMHYYYIDNRKDFIKIAKRFGINTSIESYSGKCYQMQKDGQTVILIASFNDEDATLVHECVHAGLYTLEAIGEKLDYDSEFIAYIVDTIFTNCKSMKSRYIQNT